MSAVVTRLLMLIICTGLLAACGQKGPLYLPEEGSKQGPSPP